jgi:hypothetical protein
MMHVFSRKGIADLRAKKYLPFFRREGSFHKAVSCFSLAGLAEPA